ncbi:hypothetical protein LZ31DRAFT_554988 [Colletotrichum somersetense]|nr:hypothetical protein LZ31DRAFT_554988 [Colletotrichum somersetense]
MRSLGIADPQGVSRLLASYSIDSLVAVELRNWMRFELGVEVSALKVTGAKVSGFLQVYPEEDVTRSREWFCSWTHN